MVALRQSHCGYCLRGLQQIGHILPLFPLSIYFCSSTFLLRPPTNLFSQPSIYCTGFPFSLKTDSLIHDYVINSQLVSRKLKLSFCVFVIYRTCKSASYKTLNLLGLFSFEETTFSEFIYLIFSLALFTSHHACNSIPHHTKFNCVILLEEKIILVRPFRRNITLSSV